MLDIHWILFFVNWPHDVGFIDVIEQSKGRILMTILSTSFKRHRHEFFGFFLKMFFGTIRIHYKKL